MLLIISSFFSLVFVASVWGVGYLVFQYPLLQVLVFGSCAVVMVWDNWKIHRMSSLPPEKEVVVQEEVLDLTSPETERKPLIPEMGQVPTLNGAIHMRGPSVFITDLASCGARKGAALSVDFISYFLYIMCTYEENYPCWR